MEIAAVVVLQYWAVASMADAAYHEVRFDLADL